MEEKFQDLFINPFNRHRHGDKKKKKAFPVLLKNVKWRKSERHIVSDDAATPLTSKQQQSDGIEYDHGDEEHDDQNRFENLDEMFSTRVEQGQKDIAGADNRTNFMKVVFAKPLEMYKDGILGTFTPPTFPKTSDEYNFIKQSLKNFFLYEHLDPKQQNTMIMAFENVNVTAKTVVIKQGDTTDLYYYLIESGQIQFLIDDKPIPGKIGLKGWGFGEIALLYNAPRSASAIAINDCKLWRVDQKTFRKIIAYYNIKKDDETKNLLNKVHFLKDVPDSTLTKVTYALRSLEFNKNDIVMTGIHNYFYVVKSGKVKVSNIEFGGNKYPDQILERGEYFGEVAILKNLKINATVTALEDNTVLLRMSHENFKRQLGDLEDVIIKQRDMKRLMLMPLDDKNTGLKPYEAEALAELIVDKKFKKGHAFYKEGHKTSEPVLYVIRSGNVQVSSSSSDNNDDYIKFQTGLKLKVGTKDLLTKEGFFGEEALLSKFNTNVKDHRHHTDHGDHKNKNYFVPKYTAVASEDCIVGVLTIKDIISVMTTKFGGRVKLHEIQRDKILGKGTFGTVWLISIKGNNKDVFAFKVQNKRKLIEYNQADGVINERNIMYKLDSPNIISLVDSFQDKRFLYMVMKCYQGGELRSLIRTKKRHALPEWAAKFYAASILDALTFMHKRHVLYRDLKPENIMIDYLGYTVVIDLGFAKIVPDKTYTFCGTPLYLAPEVILQKGHDKAYDLWSWGVLVYEMIVGITPFYEKGIDQVGLFKSIVNLKYEFPRGDYMSTESKDLIRKMLTIKPHERLGSFASGDLDIRNHPWFDEIDWTEVENRTLEAPWIPTISNPLDSHNFEEWEDDEDDLDDEKPLSADEQRLFEDF